jgi:hypothetical protein
MKTKHSFLHHLSLHEFRAFDALDEVIAWVVPVAQYTDSV